MLVVVVLFDLIWITFLYFGLYHSIKYLLSEKTEIFKILFNIDVKFNYYNRENRISESHDILHFMTSLIIIVICCIKPLINCFVYYIAFRFVDVTEVNFILLLTSWLQLLKCWDGLNFNLNWFIIGQVIYTMLNYKNVESLVPAIFQIVDDSFDINLFFQKIHFIFENILGRIMPLKLLDMLVWTKAHRHMLKQVRFGVLAFIGLYSLIFTDLYMTSEILFYYYAAFRLVQIYLTF